VPLLTSRHQSSCRTSDLPQSGFEANRNRR
jgi:hypothetical protein